MTTTISGSSFRNQPGQVSLQHIIRQLSISTVAHTTRRRTFILNDIPAGFYVYTNPDKLAAVLGALLNTVIMQTSDSCIRISAKPYGQVMLIHIEDHHNFNGRSFNECLEQAQGMAEKIGGTITINNYRHITTTIALSFMNLPEAA